MLLAGRTRHREDISAQVLCGGSNPRGGEQPYALAVGPPPQGSSCRSRSGGCGGHSQGPCAPAGPSTSFSCRSSSTGVTPPPPLQAVRGPWGDGQWAPHSAFSSWLGSVPRLRLPRQVGAGCADGCRQGFPAPLYSSGTQSRCGGRGL
uniref:Uncharacterized protein n=1 Tax=Pipistrellus kuhlii TaxID=59472 RepID=A0A7J7RRV6_PIPKU|nr:hypothetical protein mPipKuh1_010380 [Pipistrellus kuhlii]